MFSALIAGEADRLLMEYDIDGLVQKRRNSSALAMELRLSSTNPSIWLAIAMVDWKLLFGGVNLHALN